jgi:hypothetical protein
MPDNANLAPTGTGGCAGTRSCARACDCVSAQTNTDVQLEAGGLSVIRCSSMAAVQHECQVANDEELGLKERLKRQPSRAKRKGPRGCGKMNYDMLEYLASKVLHS